LQASPLGKSPSNYAASTGSLALPSKALKGYAPLRRLKSAIKADVLEKALLALDAVHVCGPPPEEQY
jgi:hypothetical protein